jgi:hypothetical protein
MSDARTNLADAITEVAAAMQMLYADPQVTECWRRLMTTFQPSDVGTAIVVLAAGLDVALDQAPPGQRREIRRLVAALLTATSDRTFMWRFRALCARCGVALLPRATHQ